MSRRKGERLLYPLKTSLEMPDQRRLESLAKQSGITVSEYLRKIIKEHLDGTGRE